MNLHWIDDATNGCGMVRSVLPMRGLTALGHRCAINNGEFQLNPETQAIVLGRMVLGNFRDIMLEVRRRGVKIVYDLDDALDLVEPSNPGAALALANLHSYFFMLRQADLVTVTTEELANHVRQFVPEETPIEILPNCVDPEYWQLRKRGNRIPRIGFAGGNSHLRDLIPVIQAAKGLKDAGREFEFVIFGLSSSHDSFQEYYDANMEASKRAPKSIFREALNGVKDALEGLAFRWEKAVSIDSYPGRLSAMNLDLGLCAVRECDFNRFKSVLKAYEYAMVGTDVLCSDQKPYVNELSDLGYVRFTPHDVRGWKEAMDRWIDGWSPDRMPDETAALREWVLKNRSIREQAKLWETAYANVINRAV